MTLAPARAMTANLLSEDRLTIWIDGVGAWLICLNDHVSVGGPCFEANGSDVSLMANLSRHHATIERHNESYVLQPQAMAAVEGRLCDGSVPLSSNYRVQLGNSVQFKFRIPTALSSTAVLDFVSDHRPARTVDGIILMAETCLLGPGRENHIRCPGWPESIVLFRRDGHLYCKSAMPLLVDDNPVRDAAPLQSGSIVSGEEIRFRIEPA